MDSTDPSDKSAPPAEAGPQEPGWHAIAGDPRGALSVPERRRMALALLISLLVHLPLLGLAFGGDGRGLPGFGFPWQVRRVEAPDLRVVLLPAPVAAVVQAVEPAKEPSRPVSLGPPVPRVPVPPPPARQVRQKPAVVLQAVPARAPETLAAPTESASQPDRRESAAPKPVPEPAVLAQVQPEVPTFVVPAVPAEPAPVIAEAPHIESTAAATPSPKVAEDAARARVEREKLEAERLAEQAVAAQQEATRREAARQEAARQEATRQEAARQEAARQEAARQEATRQEATRQEAARQEAARQEAARQEAARQEAARQEAARLEAARVEARLQAERQAAARVREAQEAEAKREERIRALGKQLDAEAARREAASRLPHSVNSARRARLYGRSDPNEELAQYGEAFARKIQMNMTLDMVRAAAGRPHVNPVVMTAVRSDGSVESVSFVLSSGVPALDEAIRRVVRSQEHYPAFPPALAREYDVIEIRRTWHFDVAIRLH